MPPSTVSLSLTGIPFQTALGVLQQGHFLLDATVPMPPQTLDGVLRAVESVPGALASSDAARIRDLIRQGESGEAFRRLAVYRDVLQAAHRDCEAAGAASEAVPLERIASLLGLPSPDAAYRMVPEDERLDSKAAPLDPPFARRIEIEWDGEARAFSLSRDALEGPLRLCLGRETSSGMVLPEETVSTRHAEIQFSNGRYWISDRGSTNGTFHNGHRLSAFERRPLRDGDRVVLGRCALTVRLPYELRLRNLEERLRSASSPSRIFETLEACGFAAIVTVIREALKASTVLDERLNRFREVVPHDGGILVKLESLLLRGEAMNLCAAHFPGKTPRESLEAGTRLTHSLAQADSFRDLAVRLRSAGAEGFEDLIVEIEKMHRFGLGYRRSGGGALCMADVPSLFGLRAQVHRLFMQGLPLAPAQMWDLHWRGVTPDLLLERPWRSRTVAPLLGNALEAFRGVIAERLNLDDMERSIQESVTDDTDAPLVLPVQDVTMGTIQLLYKEYQAEGDGLFPANDESASPAFFDRAVNRLASEGIQVKRYETWMYGGSVPFTAEGRIYLSLHRRYAEAIYRYLDNTVEAGIREAGGKIQFKISGHPEGYGRSDSGVVYFNVKDQETIYRLMREMSRAHPEFFKEGHPRFTMPLRDADGDALTGMSFGEEPLTDGESFGTLRAQAMTTAVRMARALMTSAEPPHWAEIRQMCAYLLEGAGVDLENPAFNAGGRAAFGWLLKRCEARSEADAAQAEAFILAEIFERYPGLLGPKAARLVRSIAAGMYRAWEKSDRFPGRARNFRRIPEDLFEEKMAVVLQQIEKNAENPVNAEFREAIVTGDQGPRVLRGLMERIASHCPLFRNPKNEKLLLTLAGNIHKAWLEGPRSAEALEGITRRLVGVLVKHLAETHAGDPFSQTLKAELETLLSIPNLLISAAYE